MKGQQIELTDITPKEIQIKSLLSGWRTATREEARRFDEAKKEEITLQDNKNIKVREQGELNK